MTDYLINRNGYYYYIRRVPAHIARYDSRKHIKISLRTKDKALARKRALIQNDAVERFWREMATSTGGAPHQHERYRVAVETARLHGFVYRDIIDIAANAELTELVDRLLALRQAQQEGRDNAPVREALAGTAEPPGVFLSQAFELFRPRCADRLAGKSDHQVRKWENPRRLALDNFIDVVGDKAITDVTRKDVLAFQEWWLERIRREGVKADSANKNLRHLKDILDSVFVACDMEPSLDLDSLFTKTKLRTGNNSRRSFDASYVQDVILDSHRLKGLNPESRALIYVMADTGARVAEITGLMPGDIRLDGKIPFVHIRSNERRGLKTPQSDRQIPLVGAALCAAQQFPEGLARYASADSASTAINKYFRHHGLNPSDDHSLYSLRHTFKDRLRDVQAPEELIDNLMGHRSRGPKYGRGHILETKVQWLAKIAFRPPKEVDWS
jgi:integrase